MIKLTNWLQFSFALFITTAFLTTAQAQSVVFISAKTGIDGNLCTFAAPCRSLAFAHSTVTANGRIVVIDSGDYSTLNITKAVTVETAPGVTAVVTNSGAGVTMFVNAGSTDKVVLRGLHLKSASPANTFGLSFQAGASLLVENCIVEGFPNAGINSITPSLLTLQNSSLRNNGTGVALSPVTAGSQNTVIDNCQIEKNTLHGIDASLNNNFAIKLIIRNSRLVNNGGIGLRAITDFSVAPLDCLVENSVVIGNGTGIHAERNGAVVRVSNSTIAGNTTGLSFVNIGNIFSRGNNTLEANNSNGSFSELYVAK